MTPDRRQQVEALFQAARAQTPEDRQTFLDVACSGNAALRREVELLFVHADSRENLPGETTPTLAILPGSASSGDARTIVEQGNVLGHYRIEEHVGAGGMGDVFRAIDTRLNRPVAIKILRGRFSERFRREALALSALNNPHICTLYDVGPDYLVMELLEGETLGVRLARGPLPLEEVVQYGSQIADALSDAHAKGITHRDLKPGNVMLTRSGAKVLDFGLARLRERNSIDTLNSPAQVTTTSPGLIVGTPAYMSPEQAQGLETDRSADIWAFGCVLYEMLTGRAAFRGTTATDILAEVLKAEPDWSRLPAATPGRIQRLLRRCLRKDVRSRFHDIADVRIELEDAQNDVGTSSVEQLSSWRRQVPWVVAAIGLAAAVFAFAFRRAAPPSEMQIVDIVTPAAADPASLALSPDGREIAFTALSPDGPQLWLRSLNSPTGRPLVGTGGASLPFWSPKDHAIAFFAESKLRRIDLGTGSVVTLANATPTPGGGTWNSDGVILFSPSLNGGIFRVGEKGEPPAILIKDGVGPRFLPDGRRFLFRKFDFGEGARMFVGSLEGEIPRPLMVANSALFAPPAQILFIRQGKLFVQGFDPDTAAVSGNESVIAQNVSEAADGVSAAVSVSRTGTIAYRTSSSDGRATRFAWFNREGNEVSRSGDTGGFSPDMTSDGRLIALSRTTNGKPNIWLLETSGNRLTQLTADPVGAQVSVFSPDGKSIVFSSARLGSVSLFKRAVDGGMEEPLLVLPGALVPTDWSADYLLFRKSTPAPGNGYDIWAMPMRGSIPSGEPFPVVQTESSERDAQFYPDGKWIAYESDRSGISEIYIHEFPGEGRERLISKGGGRQARWNPNGKELFYIAPDGHLMVVSTRLSSNGTVEAGEPLGLFRTRIGAVQQGVHTQQYLVSQSGDRFLISTAAEDAVTPITLIQNWKASPN